MHHFAKRITGSRQFQLIVSIVIVFCSIILGVETAYPQYSVAYSVFDFLFTLFFLVEIILRIMSHEPLLEFFRLARIKGKKINVESEGFWNWFDFLIVVVSITSLFQHLFPHPEFLLISRLFRVFRVLRLLEISEELKSVQKKILSIVPTIFSFALLLGILIYIYAIIGIYLFGHQQYKTADFSSLGRALTTLFQLMTLDDWGDMMLSASANQKYSWLIKGYFISFVILTAIVSFNVFVAVLTSQVHEKYVNEQKANKSKLSDLQGNIQETEQEVQAGFTKVMHELAELRKEIDRLNRRHT